MFGVVASPYILPGRVRHQQELFGVGDRDVVLDRHEHERDHLPLSRKPLRILTLLFSTN